MDNQEKNDNKIGVVLQIVSIVAISSAFIGFLVVNMYLSFFGFWDFNFLKVQYFSAGCLFLILVGFPILFFYLYSESKKILSRYTENRNLRWKKRVTIFLLKTVLLVAAVGASYAIFTLPLTSSDQSVNHYFFRVLGVFWVFVIFFSVSLANNARRDITETVQQDFNLENITKYFLAHMRLVYILVPILLLVITFSALVYPFIPRYFGGGKPVSVSIGFEKTFDSEQIGISNPTQAKLIYQSDNFLLVQVDTEVYLFKENEISFVKYIGVNKQILLLLNFIKSESLATTTKSIISK